MPRAFLHSQSDRIHKKCLGISCSKETLVEYTARLVYLEGLRVQTRLLIVGAMVLIDRYQV